MSGPLTTRLAVVNAMVALLEADVRLDGVTVADRWPGDKSTLAEIVWAAETDGELAVPTMRAGRKHYDDRFDINWQIGVVGQVGAVDRVAEIGDALYDILADDPAAGDVAEIVDSVVSRARMKSDPVPEGDVAYAELIQSVHVRLT